jgi:hypothetical protein
VQNAHAPRVRRSGVEPHPVLPPHATAYRTSLARGRLALVRSSSSRVGRDCGRLRYAATNSGGCIESTPAVFDGTIWIGTRGGAMYALGER